MAARTVTGIDVGADAVKVVRLRRRADQVELLAAGWLPLAELGRVEASEEKSRLIAQRVRELVRRERAASADCVVGISGHSTMMRYVQVPPAPPWKLDMLMKYEAAEQTPGGEECAYDYQILNITEFSGQLVVAMALAQEKALEEALSLGRSGVASEVSAEISTIGLLSAFRYGQGADEKETSMVVDVGAEEVKVVIQRGGELYFARSVPGGARRFTGAIAEELDLSFNEARLVLEEEATLGVEDVSGLDERDRKIWDACVREANQLANGLQSSIMFCRAQTKLRSLKLDRIYLTGGVSKLKGLGTYISRAVNIPVEDLATFRNISLASVKQDKLAEIDRDRQRFSTAVGLALSRMYPKAFTYTLLPERVKRRRSFLSRGIYLWYAAAIFLVALGMMTYTPVRNHSALASQLEAEKQAIDGFQKDRQAFDRVLEEHKRYDAEATSLMLRAYSGRDLLKCLSQLKKVTPEETVLLTMVTTHTPDSLKEDSGRSGKDSKEESFQKYRELYIRGYARSKKSDVEAIAIVRRYAEALAKVEHLFDGIEIAELEMKEIREEDHWHKPFTLKAYIRESTK